jgi:prepilin-type N-terminal cleavage/methylation domain-containing protein
MKKAFTLIEIMVALAIMISLLGLSLTYSQRGAKQLTLFKERARVMQEVSRARSLTATLFKEGGEKICGYGIEVPSASPSGVRDKMILFKDLSTSQDKCIGNDQEYSGTDEVVEIITLDPSVKFCTPSDRTIFFLPPKPDLYFNGTQAGANNSEAELTVCLIIDEDETATITVNILGQISSE